MAPFTICVQTMITKDGKTLRGLKPDKDGFFRDIPLAVLGKPSRNGIMYEPASMLKALSDMCSRFVINVREGNQEGEWGHPMFSSAESDRAVLERLTHIDRTRASHYIRSVKHTQTDKGIIVISGDVKPWGPYGKYLQESFEDPNRNTSFSLRAITHDIQQRAGAIVRQVLMLVTFDAVDGPGFEEASKRFSSSTESLASTFIFETSTQRPVTATDVCAPGIKENIFSTETITDQQIQDLFQTDALMLCHERIGVFDPTTKMIIRESGRRESPFHLAFGRTHGG